jgi:hypothetical protein
VSWHICLATSVGTFLSPIGEKKQDSKNIETLTQITEKWALRTTGGIILDLTDLNTDLNVYVLPNVLTTFYVSDVNGNYTTNSKLWA